MSFAYDDDESNPFADPSVRQHTQFTPHSQPSNDFSSYGGTARQAPSQSSSQPATTMPARAPSYQQETPRINNDDLLRRQEELDRKAEELQRKEQDLRRQSAAGGPRTNNFPPLPSFVPVKPCFYQDFDVDIPAQFKRTVQLVYYSWLVYVAVLFYNFIASTVFYALGPKDPSFKCIMLSLIYLIVFTPCAYTCWFRAAYNAFRSDSSFNFFLFFFMFFFQFCTCVLFAVGPNSADWGMMGWLTLLDAFDDNIFCGIVVLISAILFTLLSVAMALLLQRVHALYRTTDASFEKAQAEFSHGVMSNQTVKNATATAASSAAKNAFSGQSNP